MRSLTGGAGYQTVKPKKTASKTSIVCEHHHNSSNHGISGKENDSMQINHPKISKASTRKTMKRRDHNYSTSSSQIPTSSMISLKKVLPGKVKRKKQNSSSPKPAKLVAANIAAADECLDLIDQASLSPEKPLRNTSSGR
jgi:recombination DNA repair RAD52 pathway protein